MTNSELDPTVQGKVKSWIEDDRGIVGLSGIIDLPIGAQMSLAAGEHIADKDIRRVVFDFKDTVFFDSGLLGVLNTTHRLTVRAGLKEMSLRKITSPNIRELLKNNRLDETFVIEEEDEIDGAVSPKMKFSRYRPSDASL